MPTRDPQKFSDMRAANQQRPCMVCGTRKRHSISRLCNCCSNNLNYYGHPQAHSLRLKELRPQMVEVKRLIGINKDHPALQGFRNWWRNWVQTAKDNPSAVPAASWVSQFSEDIWEELLIIWTSQFLAFHKLKKHYYYPDEKTLSFAMARAMFQNYLPCPEGHPFYWKRQKAADRRATALYIMRFAYPLFKSFADALDAEEAERKEAERVLSLGLNYERPAALCQEEAKDDGQGA